MSSSMRTADQATSSRLKAQGKGQSSAPVLKINLERRESLPGPPKQPKQKKGKDAERSRERPTDEETESDTAVKPAVRTRVQRKFTGVSPTMTQYSPAPFSSA